jgi:AAA domain
MSTEESKSARDYLNASIDEKMQFFRRSVIKHPNIENAQKDLLSAISMATPDSLIFVFGPAGVGKSTLRTNTTNKIIESLFPELETDRERIPIVSLELPAPGPRKFDWAETFRLLLRELHEPLIDRKRAPSPHHDPDGNHQVTDRGKNYIHPMHRKTTVKDLRHSYVTSLRHRRPVAVLMDDAHYLGKVSGADLLNQLDFVKSLASHSERPHILLGTYELLALRNLSGQISRRSIDIHLPRYTSDETSQDMFASAVGSLCMKMPVPMLPSLDDDSDYLFERSAGCVGILKTWMAMALYDAISEGAPTVTLRHMKRRSYSDAALAQIFNEIVEGEKNLKNGGSTYGAVKERFLEKTPTRASATQTEEEEAPVKKKPKNKRRVGERRPARDAIGNRNPVSAGNAY